MSIISKWTNKHKQSVVYPQIIIEWQRIPWQLKDMRGKKKDMRGTNKATIWVSKNILSQKKD